MKSLILLVSVLSGLILLAACGEDEKDPHATVDGFCESWARRACSDDIESDCSVDEDECETAQRKFCENLVDGDKYDRSGADECLDDVRAAYLDGKLTARERDIVLNLGRSCEKVQNGKGDSGSSCETDTDCDRNQDLICIVRPGEPEGVCEEASVVGGGLNCKDDNEVCAAGFYCDGKNCLALADADETCSDSIPCSEDYRCLPGKDPEVLTCRPKLEEGDADCESDADCDTDICLIDGNKSVCVRNILFRATDEICEMFQR